MGMGTILQDGGCCHGIEKVKTIKGMFSSLILSQTPRLNFAIRHSPLRWHLSRQFKYSALNAVTHAHDILVTIHPCSPSFRNPWLGEILLSYTVRTAFHDVDNIVFMRRAFTPVEGTGAPSDVQEANMSTCKLSIYLHAHSVYI